MIKSGEAADDECARGGGGGLAIRKPMLIDKAVAYRSLGGVLLVSLRNKNKKKQRIELDRHA